MDSVKFTELMRKFQKTVYRVAYSYVGNSADAEDITQDAFMKLYTCSDEFAADENAKAWLIRITINLSRSHLRSAWIHKRQEMPESEICCETEREKELLESVKALPPNYRTVIYLHYCEGYKVGELAGLLRTSESNIKARLRRGREKLKIMIDE